MGDQSGRRRMPQTGQVETQSLYPDPTSESHNPYPALEVSAETDDESEPQNDYSTSPRTSGVSRTAPSDGSLSEAAKQYQLLARQLRASEDMSGTHRSGPGAVDDDDATADEAEGIPMASAYLNLDILRPGFGGFPEETGDETDVVYETEAPSDAEHRAAAQTPSKRGSGRGRGGRRRGWKWALKGTEHDPALKRVSSGKSRGRPRGSGRGRKSRGLNPGQDFKEKQSKAMKAFVEGHYDEALDHARDAVHANPEIYAAHSLLSEILRAKGQEQDSLAALLSGANTARDPDTWVMVAERTLEFAGDERTMDILQQAIFCYSQAIDLEKHGERNFYARSGKMTLWVELGEFSKARRDCKLLLALRPNDIDVVRQFAELCTMTGDPSEVALGRAAYETALEGLYEDVVAISEEQLAHAWSHLNIYLELVDRTSSADEAIRVLKRSARKFLGRKADVFWELQEADDCEFDIAHTRRYQVGDFQLGKASRDLTRYGEGLPLELRVKLGLFRLRMGALYREEAMEHFEHLMQYKDDVENLYDIFYLVATSLQAQGEVQTAIEFFEPISDVQDVLTDEFWTQFGHCFKDTEQYEAARDCFDKAVELNEANVEARVVLARLYQDHLNEKEKAWRIVDEIVAMNRRDVLRREKLHSRPRRSTATKPTKERRRAKKRVLEEHDTVGNVSETDNDAAEAHPSVRFVLPLSTANLKSAPQEPIGPPKRQRRPDVAPFVPAGPGSFGGFVLAEPHENVDIDELERQEEEERQLHGDMEKQAEKARRVEARARKQAEKLWRTGKGSRKRAKRSQQTSANDRKRELLENQSDEIQTTFAVVKDLWPAVEAGDDEDAIDEWIEAATDLYEMFRAVKQFYPMKGRQKPFRGFFRMDPGEAKFMTEMETWKSQLEKGDGDDERDGPAMGDKDFSELYQIPKPPDDSVPKDYCNISFTDWHHIFVDLALLYAKKSEQKACYEIVDNGLYGANVFYHDAAILNTTQATSLCCGFIFNDSERLCFAARWFINRADFRSGASFQLLAGVNRLSYGSSLWFSAGPTQKHMLRAVKAIDHHVFGPELRKHFDWSLQGPALAKRVERYGEGSGELDPGALLNYGHMVGVANHSQSALPYFFRAFALQPENVTINLSIATMFMQNAMKRQTDNRQYGIAQGQSFLYRYYEIRQASESPLDRQEAEYNVGRGWHMLGLTHLAIPSYERALALSEEVQRERQESELAGEPVGYEDYSREAAFALVNILAVTGNDEAAKHISETWLVL